MAQIYLRYGYRGYKSNEQFIPPGTYDDHDPLVNSILAYLVENGHGVMVGNNTDENLTPVNISTSEPADLTLTPEFTRFALEVMSDNDITEDELIAFYPDVDKFLKSHVEDYLTASDD